MEIDLWRGPSGRCPVADFLSGLPKKKMARVQKRLEQLEGLITEWGIGRLIVSGILEKLSPHDLYEITVTEVRILGCLEGNKLILTHAFKKKTQKIPIKEIEVAKGRCA